MHDWNVVVSLHEQHFPEAFGLLNPFGDVGRTGFYNVVVLRVEETRAFLDKLYRYAREEPRMFEVLSHVMPVTDTFEFSDVADFEEKAKAIVSSWLPQLTGKRFHVRMHRRGLRGSIHRTDEEKALDRYVLGSLQASGTPATIDFEDPDVVIAIETVHRRAGLALWTREDLDRYPILRHSLSLGRPTPIAT